MSLETEVLSRVFELRRELKAVKDRFLVAWTTPGRPGLVEIRADLERIKAEMAGLLPKRGEEVA